MKTPSRSRQAVRTGTQASDRSPSEESHRDAIAPGQWRWVGALGRLLSLGCLFSLFIPSTGRAQLLTVDFAADADGATTISESSPTVVLNLFNNGSSELSLGGVNFFVKVGGGLQGPTLSTTAPPASTAGVDLLTGTPFATALGGQLPISVADFSARNQAWSVTLDPSASLGAGQTVRLATLTFNSFPMGSYALDFTGTTFPWYNPVIEEAENHTALFPLGTEITVVPEPEGSALVAGLGILVIALWRRIRPVSCENPRCTCGVRS